MFFLLNLTVSWESFQIEVSITKLKVLDIRLMFLHKLSCGSISLDYLKLKVYWEIYLKIYLYLFIYYSYMYTYLINFNTIQHHYIFLCKHYAKVLPPVLGGIMAPPKLGIS